MAETGTLYVVGTPIGNLEDVTLRALRILREVDVIACEDTRHTRRLLARHDIDKPLVSYHEHNERERAGALLRRLAAGQDVALVTDAGMPGVSDPGYQVISQAIAEGIPVVPVPGPSAVTAALAVSGLPTDRFLFVGFLPRTRSARHRALEEIRPVAATLVLFEAPHRIRETLVDVADVLGARRVALVRELTKIHEEVVRGRADEVARRFEESPARGEITLVVQGATEAPAGLIAEPADVKAYVRRLVTSGISRRDAARQAAEALGVSRRDAYRLSTEEDEG